jgi:hypothetical protein
MGNGKGARGGSPHRHESSKEGKKKVGRVNEKKKGERAERMEKRKKQMEE